MKFYQVRWPYSWMVGDGPTIVALDMMKETPRTFVLLEEGRTYRMTVRKSDMARKSYHSTPLEALAASLVRHEKAVENGRERWTQAQKRVEALQTMMGTMK